MTIPHLTLQAVELRSVSVPLNRSGRLKGRPGRPVRSLALILIDLLTKEDVVGRGYLEPYLERSVRAPG